MLHLALRGFRVPWLSTGTSPFFPEWSRASAPHPSTISHFRRLRSFGFTINIIFNVSVSPG